MGSSSQCVSNTHALPAGHKCLESNKTEQSIYECLLGFCFNNIFFNCYRQFSSAQFRNEEMMGDGFPLVLLLPVCFEQ